MNLLVISNNAQRSSFRGRIGNYVQIMKDRGIVLTVIVPSKSLRKRMQQYRQINHYDAVLVHKKCFSWLDGLFFRPSQTRVIFNYDDAIMFNHEGRPTRTHAQRFRRSLRKATTVLVGSSYLAQLAAPYHNNIKILPLGLKTDRYDCPDLSKKDEKVRLVWIGSPATLDYLEPLQPIIQKLAQKHPNLVLRLVCEEFLDIEGVCVEKIRWTPEIRYRALSEADIGLAPLPDNRFTQGKCPFKVLEYSASGIPVVASPVGTSVDHIKDGVTGYLASTPDQWFEKLDALLDNPTLRREMGARGREYAKTFDTSVIGESLCDLILQTASDAS